MNYVHAHSDGIYRLYDNNGNSVEAVYDTDYESNNGLDEDEDGYEEFQCILIKRTSDGVLFEVKSGKRYSTTSLNAFIEKYKDRIGESYIIHPRNFIIKDDIVCIPPYMTMML